MVAYNELVASNAQINDDNIPSVSVFVGGTSGIGKLTIEALVATKTSIKIYLIGRQSSKSRSEVFIEELKLINPNAEILWVEGEIALLEETKRIALDIRNKEPRIDLLFLTAGFAPVSPRVYTSEGVEVAQSLEYYSRILFIQHLLPSLNAATAARVISVQGGGLESMRAIDLDDLDLKKPGNFSFLKGQPQYLTMATTALEKLADDNPNITFIHAWPGWVNTGNLWRTVDPNSWTGWFAWLTLHQLMRLFSTSEEVAGQRYLFQITSAAFGGRGISWSGKQGLNSRSETGNGLFLVKYNCDCTPNAKVVPRLRVEARPKVWAHTQEILKPYL